MCILCILTLFIAAAEFCLAGSLRPTASGVECHDPGVHGCFEYKFKNNKFEVNAEWTYIIEFGDRKQITCRSNGEWSAPIPGYPKDKTDTRYCSHPLGNLRDEYEVGTNWLIGGENVTCMDDDRWAGHVSKCKSSLYRLASGNDTRCPSILGEGECHEPGETVSVGSCGEADSQFTCGKYGRWIGKIPTCEGKHFEWHKWQFPSSTTCFHKLNAPKFCVSPAFPQSSPVGTFPWQAALAIKVDDDRKGSYNGWFIYCGGALVSDKWVLTSAHCLTEPSSQVALSLSSVSVFLGKHFRNDQLDDDHVIRLGPKKLVYHPSFDPISLDNDIGLLELEVEVQFTDRIRPICLPQLGTPTPMTELQSERFAVVAGWGRNHLNEPNEDLGHVLVKYANMSECKINGHTNQTFFFCGKPYFDIEGWTCPGDSGGPLIFQEFYDGHSRYVVEGLVSFGEKYCTDARTSYIKVRPYLCWIKDIIMNGNIMGNSRIPEIKSNCQHYS